MVTKSFNGITGEYWAHGGLAYFLAMFITLVTAQTINFFMQRKIAFKSNSNVWFAMFWYVVATLIITIGNSALYGIYQPWLYNLIGEALGGYRRGVPTICDIFLGILPDPQGDF